MEHRQINENYQCIAEELIDTESDLKYIKDSRVRIAYLESDSSKKADADKLVLGECEKVAAKNKWAINYDFTITLYKNNLVGFSADQIRIVMFHELLHVGIEPGPEGDEIYSVRKHDLEDFKLITVRCLLESGLLGNFTIDKYGTDWSKAARKAK